MKKIFFIILVLLMTGMGYAQDPGIPDTVNFGTCQSYIVADGDSLYGKVKVPLRIFNDECLASILICLKWSGPMIFDTLYFYGTRGDSIDSKSFGFDNDQKRGVIEAITFLDGGIPPDTGIFVSMIFQVFDTGVAKIDTHFTAVPECPLWFISCALADWRPLFEAKQFQLVKSDTIPGDLNANKVVNLADIVILINYLFKNQYQGFFEPAGDVNCDCEIKVSDILYLIDYIFKAGEKPKPGCAF